GGEHRLRVAAHRTRHARDHGPRGNARRRSGRGPDRGDPIPGPDEADPGSVKGSGIVKGMCRSIKTLRRPDEPATEEEIHAAALQFVRKISGYREPSRANSEAFLAAVEEISRSSRRLLEAVAVAKTA